MAAAPGKPSALHPTLKMTWKRAMKIERIARLSLDPAMYTNEQIANMLQVTPQTIVYIRQLPAYHAKMIEVQTGITSAWDGELRTDSETARAELKSMLPSSMMVIRNALLSKNENLRFKAAMEVMDREGTLAKVSKTSVAVTTAPDMNLDAGVQSNLMNLLAAAPQLASGSDVVAATGGFTINASDAATQQAEMATNTTEATLQTLKVEGKPN